MQDTNFMLQQHKLIKLQCENNRFYRDLHIRDLVENARQLQEISLTTELDGLTAEEKLQSVQQIVDYYHQNIVDTLIKLECIAENKKELAQSTKQH